MNDRDGRKFAGYYSSLSAVSRYIRMYYGQTPLAHGTCLFVMSADGPVLVTNRREFAQKRFYGWAGFAHKRPLTSLFVCNSQSCTYSYYLDITAGAPSGRVNGRDNFINAGGLAQEPPA